MIPLGNVTIPGHDIKDVDRLNVGAGRENLPEYASADIVGYENIDFDLDIGSETWPFHDNSISEVRAAHVLEHLTRDEYRHAIHEAHRVLEPGGLFRVIGPHHLRWNEAAGDHYRAFSRVSFNCWCAGHDHAGEMPLFRKQSYTLRMVEDMRLSIRVLARVMGRGFVARHVPNTVEEIEFKLRKRVLFREK